MAPEKGKKDLFAPPLHQYINSYPKSTISSSSKNNSVIKNINHNDNYFTDSSNENNSPNSTFMNAKNRSSIESDSISKPFSPMESINDSAQKQVPLYEDGNSFENSNLYDKFDLLQDVEMLRDSPTSYKRSSPPSQSTITGNNSTENESSPNFDPSISTTNSDANFIPKNICPKQNSNLTRESPCAEMPNSTSGTLFSENSTYLESSVVSNDERDNSTTPTPTYDIMRSHFVDITTTSRLDPQPKQTKSRWIWYLMKTVIFLDSLFLLAAVYNVFFSSSTLIDKFTTSYFQATCPPHLTKYQFNIDPIDGQNQNYKCDNYTYDEIPITHIHPENSRRIIPDLNEYDFTSTHSNEPTIMIHEETNSTPFSHLFSNPLFTEGNDGLTCPVSVNEAFGICINRSNEMSSIYLENRCDNNLDYKSTDISLSPFLSSPFEISDSVKVEVDFICISAWLTISLIGLCTLSVSTKDVLFDAFSSSLTPLSSQEFIPTFLYLESIRLVQSYYRYLVLFYVLIIYFVFFYLNFVSQVSARIRTTISCLSLVSNRQVPPNSSKQNFYPQNLPFNYTNSDTFDDGSAKTWNVKTKNPTFSPIFQFSNGFYSWKVFEAICKEIPYSLFTDIELNMSISWVFIHIALIIRSKLVINRIKSSAKQLVNLDL